MSPSLCLFQKVTKIKGKRCRPVLGVCCYYAAIYSGGELAASFFIPALTAGDIWSFPPTRAHIPACLLVSRSFHRNAPPPTKCCMCHMSQWAACIPSTVTEMVDWTKTTRVHVTDSGAPAKRGGSVWIVNKQMSASCCSSVVLMMLCPQECCLVCYLYNQQCLLQKTLTAVENCFS